MSSPVAWFPVALLLFGSGGHAAPIFIMVIAGLWPLVFNPAQGNNTLDRDWLAEALSLGGDTRRIILELETKSSLCWFWWTEGIFGEARFQFIAITS